MDSSRRINSLFLSALLTAAAVLQGQTGDKKAAVILDPLPSGYRVRMDSCWLGTTPLDTVTAVPGRHTLYVYSAAPDLWAAFAGSKDVVLKAGEVRRIQMDVRPAVWVASHPSGADVYRKGRHIGTTPLAAGVDPGDGAPLILRRKGFSHTSISSEELRPGTYVLARLQPEEGKAAHPSLKKAPVKWLLGGMAAAVLLGTAGYICKQKADRAYEEYRKTGHPEKMQDHYEQVKRFDRLSGIFYVSGEIGLGVTLYFSIKHVW